jgi:hypothetical protein
VAERPLLKQKGVYAMRRHRRGYLSGLFFNTGNYDVRSEENNLEFTRQFSDAINQEMMDDERLERKHRQEGAVKQENDPDAEKSMPDTPKP